MGVTLNRDMPAQLSGIENNPNNYYRAHGLGGWKDFLNTGEIRPTEAYSEAYFSKGAPLGRYTAANRSGASHIVETNTPRMGTAANGYPTVDKLTNKDYFKIFAKNAEGAYDAIHTNIPREWMRRSVGALGKVVNAAALPLQIGEAIWNATEDQRNRNAYKQWLIDRANIPMDTEIRSR